MQSVVILGAGRLGQTLGYLVQHSTKYRVSAIWNRSQPKGLRAAKFIGGKPKIVLDPSQAARLGEIVFITTPDDVIKDLCGRIARDNGFRKQSLIIHCSGNFSSAILESAQRLGGCRIATLHPLQSFAQPAEAVRNFRGTYCACEGDKKALPPVRALIKELGGIPVRINAVYKPLYHAAGVVASNYLVTLLAVAREFITASGFSPKTSLAALMPLVEGTIQNMKHLGIPAALTGPIARGDISTIQHHLSAIRKQLKQYLPIYQALGKYTVNLARAKGNISREQIQVLRKLLE